MLSLTRVLALSLAMASLQQPTPGQLAPSRDERTDSLPALTRAFASLDVRDMNGRHWTAASLRGRVVLLDFWATWCAPCLADLPYVRRAHEQFGDRFTVVGVSLDSGDRRTLHAWLNRHRVDWPQVWDARAYNGRLAQDFRVDALPRSVLVNAAGEVVATNLRGQPLVDRIAALVRQQR